MSTIDIELEALDTGISELKRLLSEVQGYTLEQATASGSGSVVVELGELGSSYRNLQRSFVTLIGNSLSFFEGVKSSYVDADKTAAGAVSGA